MVSGEIALTITYHYDYYYYVAGMRLCLEKGVICAHNSELQNKCFVEFMLL